MWNIAFQQVSTGHLKDAETNLCKALDLRVGGLDDGFCLRELGRLHLYKGEWEEAKQKIQLAINIFGEEKESILYFHIYGILKSLLLAREQANSKTEWLKDAQNYASKTLELFSTYKEFSERDFIEVYWSIGSVFRIQKQVEEADRRLNESLEHCRAINNLESEADILLDLARLRYDQKKYDEAKSLADEALLITKRCGYVLQGADVNLFLAQYALEQEKDRVKAKQYAEEALKLATCDGPPYYYKVAYEEAERMLKKLKE